MFRIKVFKNLVLLTLCILIGYLFLVGVTTVKTSIIVTTITYFTFLIGLLIKRTENYIIKDDVIEINTIFRSFSIRIKEILYIEEVWDAPGTNLSNHMIAMNSKNEEIFKIDLLLKNKENKSLLTVLRDKLNISVNKI